MFCDANKLLPPSASVKFSIPENAEGKARPSPHGHHNTLLNNWLYRHQPLGGAARQVHGHTTVLLNAAAQPLERGLGEWHAEWAPLVDSALLLEGALEQAAVLLEGLEVHPEAMQRNLAATGGGIMAEPVAKLLAPTLGPDAAKRISAEAAETARLQGGGYAAALNAHPEVQGRLDPEQVARVTEPSLYLGSSRAQVARAAEWLMSI